MHKCIYNIQQNTAMTIQCMLYNLPSRHSNETFQQKKNMKPHRLKSQTTEDEGQKVHQLPLSTPYCYLLVIT